MTKALSRFGLVALASLTLASEARAQDPPNITGFVLIPTFIAPVNTIGFTTTFLYGVAGNDNSLLYRLGTGNWDQLFYITGNFPFPSGQQGQTASRSFSALLAPTEVQFALCQGNILGGGATLTCPGNGPYLTGAGSTNVLAGTSAQWNSVRGGLGIASPDGETVFGFEDTDLALSDRDFNDLMFSTNLDAIRVPEPSSLMLAGFGLVGLVGAGLRRRNSNK